MHVKIIRNFPKALTCMTQFCHLNATDFILGGTGRESFLVVFLKLHRATLEKERGGGGLSVV